MNDTPTGFPPDLDAAVRERQAAPVPKVRIVVPERWQDKHEDWCVYEHEVIAAIRAAGCVPVNAKGEEL